MSAEHDGRDMRHCDECLTDAYARMRFNLTYRYEPGRRIDAGGIDGGFIPNAYRPTSKRDGRQAGEWHSEVHCYGGDPFLHAFSSAINEAVHEALEWFKVDGKVVLDPHGPAEGRIMAAVDELAARLFGMVDPSRVSSPPCAGLGDGL